MTTDFAVITCVYNRPERLPKTVDMLRTQTDREFDLWVICNNTEHAQLVSAYVAQLNCNAVYNPENRGPYARIELMHAMCQTYRWFITIDDDVDFCEHWFAQWRSYASHYKGEMLGWRGFRFKTHYWDRQRPTSTGLCDYLWGSNLMVPAYVAESPDILQLPPRYWNSDDLWLCYYANHVVGIPLREVCIHDNYIVVDGKDTYISQHDTKIALLGELREMGWDV